MERPKIDPEKFGLALTAWSIEKSMPLRQIAFALEVSPNSLYCYTKTRQDAPNVLPRIDRAAEIADALGITLDELARGPHGEGLQHD